MGGTTEALERYQEGTREVRQRHWRSATKVPERYQGGTTEVLERYQEGTWEVPLRHWRGTWEVPQRHWSGTVEHQNPSTKLGVCTQRCTASTTMSAAHIKLANQAGSGVNHITVLNHHGGQSQSLQKGLRLQLVTVKTGEPTFKTGSNKQLQLGLPICKPSVSPYIQYTSSAKRNVMHTLYMLHAISSSETK